jgi:hypothetical protein
MTQDEIIEMMLEAGLLQYGIHMNNLKVFANLVAQYEREACAKICDFEWGTPSQKDLGIMFAQAIRARGEA